MDNYYHNPNLINRRHNQYAVVMFLPSELDAIVAPLRTRYDPDSTLIESHLTVVFPFQSDAPLEDLCDLIRRETKTHPSIQIEFDSMGDFYPTSPVIYWAVRENEQLKGLNSRLYSRLGLTVPHGDFVPHVTIAREISPQRLMLVKEEIIPFLSHEKFYTERIDLVSPLGDRRWVSIRKFPLGK
jgi:2'-5' RNA ligase